MKNHSAETTSLPRSPEVFCEPSIFNKTKRLITKNIFSKNIKQNLEKTTSITQKITNSLTRNKFSNPLPFELDLAAVNFKKLPQDVNLLIDAPIQFVDDKFLSRAWLQLLLIFVWMISYVTDIGLDLWFAFNDILTQYIIYERDKCKKVPPNLLSVLDCTNYFEFQQNFTKQHCEFISSNLQINSESSIPDPENWVQNKDSNSSSNPVHILQNSTFKTCSENSSSFDFNSFKQDSEYYCYYCPDGIFTDRNDTSLYLYFGFPTLNNCYSGLFWVAIFAMFAAYITYSLACIYIVYSSKLAAFEDYRSKINNSWKHKITFYLLLILGVGPNYFLWHDMSEEWKLIGMRPEVKSFWDKMKAKCLVWLDMYIHTLHLIHTMFEDIPLLYRMVCLKCV